MELVNGKLQEKYQIGELLRGEYFEGDGTIFEGMLVGEDSSDCTLQLCVYRDGNYDDIFISTPISDAPCHREPERIDKCEGFPSQAKPNFIFLLIFPRRQVQAFATMDALLEGYANSEVLLEIAPEAIAEPETDVKIPGTAGYLRFTAVEGA